MARENGVARQNRVIRVVREAHRRGRPNQGPGRRGGGDDVGTKKKTGGMYSRNGDEVKDCNLRDTDSAS